MIKTGIDVVEISRFENMKNPDDFFARVFTDEEVDYFSKKKNNKWESVAGFYAAKEAFSKYLGSGIRGFSFKDIEVCHNDLGKPYIRFKGEKIDADVSISHSDTVATAIVCGEDIVSYPKTENVEFYRGLLPKRFPDMNKGDCGRLFILAGSLGMTGAAELCAMGALRSGSGLVTVGTAKSQQPILATKLTEDEVSFMSCSCRYSKMWYLAVFDSDRILYPVSQFTKATSKDNTSKGLYIPKSTSKILYRFVYLYKSLVHISSVL